MAVPTIPCKVGPEVPNPVYMWKMCTANPDAHALSGTLKMYFGYTQSLTETYMIILILSFLFSISILYIAKKSTK